MIVKWALTHKTKSPADEYSKVAIAQVSFSLCPEYFVSNVFLAAFNKVRYFLSCIARTSKDWIGATQRALCEISKPKCVNLNQR